MHSCEQSVPTYSSGTAAILYRTYCIGFLQVTVITWGPPYCDLYLYGGSWCQILGDCLAKRDSCHQSLHIRCAPKHLLLQIRGDNTDVCKSTAGSPASHLQGRQKVSIPECDLTGRRVSESSKNPLFSKLSVHNILNARVHVSRPWWYYEQSFMLSQTFLAMLMLVSECLCTPLKISLTENETTVNLIHASLVMIMHLHEGWTHIQFIFRLDFIHFF